MNLAKAGRQRIAWYYEFHSTTSKSRFSLLKFPSFPKTTPRLFLPSGEIALPGTILWKVVSEVFKMEVGMNISRSISMKMILMLLPPSMNTRDMS